MVRLSKLASQKGVAAMGAVGLDYVRTPESKETQLELFQREVSLAR